MENLDAFPYVICWDLDRTLGVFEKAYWEKIGYCSNPDSNVIATRYGIKAILSEFRKSDYHQFITTSASEDYANTALTRSGLIEFFDPESHVWDYEITAPRYGRGGKVYGGIEEGQYRYDETRRVYPHKMIAIGDAPGDISADLENMVTILEPNAAFHNALVVKIVLQLLLKKGSGSFFLGFNNLYESGDNAPFNQGKRIQLSNGITLDFNHLENNPHEFPYIKVTTTANFEKPMDIIEA